LIAFASTLSLSVRAARLLLRGPALIVALLLLAPPASAPAQDVVVSSWSGTLRNPAGVPIPNAVLTLEPAPGSDSSRSHSAAPAATEHAPSSANTATTTAQGTFSFAAIRVGAYRLSIRTDAATATLPAPLVITANATPADLVLTDQGTLSLHLRAVQAATTGGEQLSSNAVSGIPLNKRDFSQLLLLAAGTMTDSNGATNFTAQFAINGQRGVEAVFAMDGADISDPEMGGATFSNFNVDAVQEIQSSSGWMPAEIGRGAAGFTNIVTRSGAAGFHGSVFEFLRNSSLDARNYFDHPSIAEPGRIPPFRRNEFGFTNGGPVRLPHLYDGRGKTFYFGQYQGFRQVLGTTQVLPVPTAGERAGRDSTAFAGDTLFIPVDPAIAAVLARYPLPNYPQGAFGPHTYATSSKVVTDANQFSIRIDHRISDKSQFFARFNFNNLNGPTTNPDQTAIDPSFAVDYIDRQRNVIGTYTRDVSPHFSLESSISITRTTPSFPTPNHTDPAVKYTDGLFEPFNSAAGSVMTAFGNLFQGRQNFTWTRGNHAFKWGAEVRLNRDTTYFGTSPNGEYDFGGGPTQAPYAITSASGQHNYAPGDTLPDTLSALLTGSPYQYTVAVSPPLFSSGAHSGPAAISRNSAGFYFQDSWKMSPRFVLDYGLRYELYSPIEERAHRTSAFRFLPHGGQEYLVNPQPGYKFNLTGWAPRVRLTWRAPRQVEVSAGAGITTIPPNIWQDNFLTGATPFVIYPRPTSAPGAPIRYGFQITPDQLPPVYTPSGQKIFASGDTKKVPANTVMDVDRFEHDMADLSPSHQLVPLSLTGIASNFGNAYLQTWSLGLERRFGSIDGNLGYVGTAAVHLPRITFPNGYPGASPQFAPYTQFNSAGLVTGGFGFEQMVDNPSHSTYHALQASAQGTAGRSGPSIQASYTWSKSIDDTSTVLGGFIAGGAGAIAQAWPENPYDTHIEKGPSTFDTNHAFTLTLVQDFHAERADFLRPVTQKLTAGWELLSISTITSGAPFTVYSGVQQTGVGSYGVDRPDQIAKPHLSTARKTREDYFGLGDNNASFFSIPINVPGGTGPNQGRFGTLGRDTFRGPAYYDYDFALIKDTPFGRRGNGELVNLQFRSEFFNLFNIVNMGLPSNTIKGTGFGIINRTAGTSRQIQFSLKLLY
jgi:hypothetical protein